MDIERIRISAGVYGLRIKNKLRLILQFAGVGLLLIGAYNIVFAGIGGGLIKLWPAVDVIVVGETIARLSDVAALFGGLILAWIS